MSSSIVYFLDGKPDEKFKVKHVDVSKGLHVKKAIINQRQGHYAFFKAGDGGIWEEVEEEEKFDANSEIKVVPVAASATSSGITFTTYQPSSSSYYYY